MMTHVIIFDTNNVFFQNITFNSITLDLSKTSLVFDMYQCYATEKSWRWSEPEKQ
jgi:hypothetical protein